MGGKGGGGGQDTGLGEWVGSQFDQDKETGWLVNKDSGEVWENLNSGPNKGHKDVVFAARNQAAADAAAAAEKAAEPEAAPVAAPAAAAPAGPPAPAIDTTVAPPATLGGAPSTGDALGGAVLKPPRYWVGGLDQYENASRTGRGNSGSLRTTQT